MGGGNSKNSITKEEADAAIHVEPLYYIKDAVVTSDDIVRARASWKMISDDTSPAFIAAKQAAEPLEAASCLAWFYESFYQRLFDVHPSSRMQFKNNIVVQGKALVKMIGAALSLLEDPANLSNALVDLAKNHTKKGVMSFQYGIVGEVLIWTLALCLGPAFDEDTKLAWLKIYSYMLKVILPVATTEERSVAASTASAAAAGKMRASGTLVLDTINDPYHQLQLNYDLAKKRASELSALSLNSPAHLKSKLALASKAYLSLSTIFYTTLTINQLGDLDMFVHGAALQLPKTLFDINEWQESLSQANDIRVREFKRTVGSTLDGEVSILRNGVEEMKSKVETQVGALSEVFDIMKQQVISVLKEEEIKLKRMENEALVKDVQVQEAYLKLENQMRQSVEELDRTHKYYEKEMLEQKRRLTNELEYQHEEKIAAMNKLYEDRIKSIEEKHEMKVGELNGVIFMVKQQLHDKSMDFEKSKESIEELRTSQQSLLSESLSTNKLMVGVLHQKISELEAEKGFMEKKHKDDLQVASDKISAILAQVEESTNIIRGNYEKEVRVRDEEIEKLKLRLGELQKSIVTFESYSSIVSQLQQSYQTTVSKPLNTTLKRSASSTRNRVASEDVTPLAIVSVFQTSLNAATPVKPATPGKAPTLGGVSGESEFKLDEEHVKGLPSPIVGEVRGEDRDELLNNNNMSTMESSLRFRGNASKIDPSYADDDLESKEGIWSPLRIQGRKDGVVQDIETLRNLIEKWNLTYRDTFQTLQFTQTDLEITQETLATLKSSFADLSGRHRSKENECESLRNQCNELQNNNRSLQWKLTETESQLTQSNADKDDMSHHLKAVRHELSQLRSNYEKSCDNLSKCEQSLLQTQTALETSKESLTKLQGECESNEVALRESREAYIKLLKEFQQSERAMAMQREKLIVSENDCSRLSELLSSTDSSLKIAQTHLERSQDAYNRLEKQSNVTEQELSSAKSVVVECQDAVKRLSVEKTRAESALNNAQDELTQSQKKFAELSEQFHSAQTTLKLAQNELTQSKDSFAKLSVRHAEIDAELTQLRDKHTESERALALCREELIQNQRENYTLLKKNKDNEIELSTLKRDLETSKKLQNSRNDLSNRIKELETELHETKENLNVTTQKLSECKKSSQELTTVSENDKSLIQQLQQQVETLTDLSRCLQESLLMSFEDKENPNTVNTLQTYPIVRKLTNIDQFMNMVAKVSTEKDLLRAVVSIQKWFRFVILQKRIFERIEQKEKTKEFIPTYGTVRGDSGWYAFNFKMYYMVLKERGWSVATEAVESKEFNDYVAYTNRIEGFMSDDDSGNAQPNRLHLVDCYLTLNASYRGVHGDLYMDKRTKKLYFVQHLEDALTAKK